MTHKHIPGQISDSDNDEIFDDSQHQLLKSSSSSSSTSSRTSSIFVKYKWYGYLVLIFSAMNVIFLGGKRRAFGIFVADLHHGEFNTTSLAELNWIGDSYAALGYISTTFTTATILRFNRRYRLSQLMGSILILIACVTSSLVPSPHWLFITHTLLHGLGSSFILSTVGLIVNEYFPQTHRHHLLATTLVSGGSVASIVFVELYAFLISTYGWRNSFLILGAIYFVVNTSACFVFSALKQTNSTSNVNKKNCSLSTCCSTGFIKKWQWPLLICWLIDRILTSVVTYGLLLNLADYRRRTDPNLTSAASLTLLFAAGEATTYLIGAIVLSSGSLASRYINGRLRYILLITTGLLSASLVVWELVASTVTLGWLSNLLAFISGLCLGPSITFLFPAGEELTRLPGHMAYPYSLCGMGIGMAISPLFTAILAQVFNYKWFFMIQGGLMGIKFVCLSIICCLLANKNISIHRVDAEEVDNDELSNESDLEVDNSSCTIKKEAGDGRKHLLSDYDDLVDVTVPSTNSASNKILTDSKRQSQHPQSPDPISIIKNR